MYEYTKPRGPIAAMYSSPGPCYQLPTLVGSMGHDIRSNQPKAPAYPFGLKYAKSEPLCNHLNVKSSIEIICFMFFFRHKAYLDDSSPGPVYSLPKLEASVNALPHWSMSSRKFPPSEAK